MNEIHDLLPELGFDDTEPDTYRSNRYDIVSKVGYLIGVSLTIFESENSTLDKSVFEQLNADKNARIIRNLCILRTHMFRGYSKIEAKLRYEMKNIDSIPEYIPSESVTELQDDGVGIWHANWRINQYLMYICDEIKNRISGCRTVFPLWLNWDFIKELFVIPNFKTDKQLKSAGVTFQSSLSYYPYQMYIHWKPRDLGNILYNDEKFVAQTLYPMHQQTFPDISKLKDASDATKADIHNFLNLSEETVIVVDCENSNPYKLYSTLSNMPQEELKKIHKIILYNDIHASVTWRLLKRFISGIEHIMVPRVKGNKSLVDITLAVGACKEYYEHNITSFILVSSDSDYWGLIKGLDNCSFLVLVEKDKTSRAIKEAMERNDITYAYIDDFCSGNLEKIQMEALQIEIRSYLSGYSIDMNQLFDKAVLNTRAELSDEEIEQFKTKCLKQLHIVSTDGIVKVEL